MRALGVDFGQKRLGLALSDASGTLARPWKTIPAGTTPAASAALMASLLDTSSDPDLLDAPVDVIVVGVPRRLNGDDTDQTRSAREFAAALRAAISLQVHEQDERLTSHEADRLLAAREPDWRRRKEKLDAAAAAVILQDYLDQHSREDTRS